MIFTDYDRFKGFIGSFPVILPEELLLIRNKALLDHVPIIRDDTQRLMALLMQEKRPERILEIGTAVGFSALLMAQFDTALKELVTIENYEPRIRQAKENFSRSNAPISLRCGDAKEILLTIEGSFDFVFIDAAKAQYPDYLKLIMPHLSDGALIVADNILQEGRILEPKEALCRRDRTIHKRIREYLRLVMENQALFSTLLPVGDGLALSVYQGNSIS